jgi:rfaE bifunctional protein kinase chain/domain
MKVHKLSDLLEQVLPRKWEGAAICYGHFDVIHPGHMRYFANARTYGQPLIVVIEGDLLLERSGDFVVFSESERAFGVAALDLVDDVVILDVFGLEEFIQWVHPSVLVLGKEFEKERFYEVQKSVHQIELVGGRAVYEAGETRYSTSNLGIPSQEKIESQRETQFSQILESRKIDIERIVKKIQAEEARRILVIGDTIVDQFVDCDPLGMSSEAPLVVVKERERQDFLGGAGIVAAHLLALGAHAIYLSVIGDDAQGEVASRKLIEYGVQSHLIRDPGRPTTSKIRYLVDRQKIFRVSQLSENVVSGAIEEQLISKLEELASSLDAIVVSDFNYGVVTPRVLSILEGLVKAYGIRVFGDLQCSSQIGNVGKFRGFFALTPTEREARIALSNQTDSLEYVANSLLEKTGAANLFLKLGSEGVVAYCTSQETGFLERQHFPALCVNPVDVAGAGDAMLATVAAVTTADFSAIEAAAVATVASNIAVRTMGNHPIKLKDIMNYSFSRKFC